MNKAKKNITVSYDILEDMEKKGISLSFWVDRKYREIELGSKGIKDKIKENTQEIEELKKLAGNLEKEEKIRENEEKQEIQSYSQEKIDFFKITYNRVKNGYDINANYQLFCFDFGDDITLPKFKQLVKYYGEQNELQNTP